MLKLTMLTRRPARSSVWITFLISPGRPIIQFVVTVISLFGEEDGPLGSQDGGLGSGFVLDVDRSTPPILFHHGEGFRLERLPRVAGINDH